MLITFNCGWMIALVLQSSMSKVQALQLEPRLFINGLSNDVPNRTDSSINCAEILCQFVITT